jgi:hypothetical protein
MDRGICGFVISLALALIAGGASSQKANVPADTFRLDSLDGLELVNAKAEVVNYRGHRALHLIPLPGHEAGDEMMMAILKDVYFGDGTIEAEVAGAPRAGAAPDQRGFIGILFRVQEHMDRGLTIFICGPRMGAAMISFAAIIPCSMNRRRIFPGTG